MKVLVMHYTNKAQVPFADDLRKFTFRSLDQLLSKKGNVVTKHAHLPTDEQMSAMENFVDAMDLMQAGDKDDNGYISKAFNLPSRSLTLFT